MHGQIACYNPALLFCMTASSITVLLCWEEPAILLCWNCWPFPASCWVATANPLQQPLSKSQLFLAQGDNAALMTEIDNTSEAYESIQSSNTGLVQQLGERDARISQLTGEQLRHDQALARGKADRELAETASRTAQQHKQGLEKRAQELQSDLQVLF